MKILLTGATGYIGKRLLPVLLENGHEIVCCVRDKARFTYDKNYTSKIEVAEVDFLNPDTLNNITKDIDAGYYLIHSMTSTSGDFEKYEEESAINFREYINTTNAKHIIYLSGIVNENNLSKHLSSRKNVEEILAKGKYNFTTLRAGIIIGSGSASFEIIRDLVEKLPLMITPKWLLTKSQPIAIRDVISFLTKSLLNEKTYNNSFDIGGPDILTYKEMLLKFAKIRKLKRIIITLPVLTPRLSSYWLYFVTSVSYTLAVNLVNSMKIEVICRDNKLRELLNITPLTYEQAIESAFQKIEEHHILSSWKDSLISGRISDNLYNHIQVPENGCYKDKRHAEIKNTETVLNKLWHIGGDTGWYYANFLWGIRGFVDKLFGGVGLRRGRTSPDVLNNGDTLDFWRVLLANKQNMRLLLYAEMKVPGEAWLEFKIEKNKLNKHSEAGESEGENYTLYQTATFRPKGLLGRLYWYSVLPFHFFVFSGMLKKIAGH
jgi:uncharacterized protein YbjT (DUF2867 family)